MNLLDRILASDRDRHDAEIKGRNAIKLYGDRAEEVLLERLAHPDRSRSRRQLRLAIAEIRKRRKARIAP